MRRVAFCMILLLAAPLANAAVRGGYNAADASPCVEASATAAHVPSPDSAVARSAATPALRTPATTQGGGSDADLGSPRTRMPRWHSFLPGMFR